VRRLRRLGAAGVLAAFLSVAAWQVSPLAKTTTPAAPALPATIQGLKVGQENVSKTLAEDRRALYVDGVWLYSLRQGKELMATLEVARFKSTAPWRSSGYDLSLANQLGGSIPAVLRLDGRPVYVSTTRGLELITWFKDGYLDILAVRSTYNSPKSLLRAVIAVAP
jgi:hypothetical protein